MSVQRLVTVPEISAALPAAFAGQSRLTLPGLINALRDCGLRLPSAAGEATDLVLDAVEWASDRFAVHEDPDVIVDIEALLDGVTLTHRLDEQEVAEDELVLEADAPGYASDLLASRGLQLPDGQVVGATGSEWDWAGSFPLHGSLASLDLGAGDLVGVRFEGGAAHLVAVAEPGSPAVLVAWLRGVLQEQTRIFEELLDDAMVTTTVFQHLLPPLTEVLPEHGFGFDGVVVAATPQTLAGAVVEEEARELAREYDLTEEEAAAAVLLLRAADTLRAHPDASLGEPLMLEMARAIANPWLAFVAGEEAAGAREGFAQLVELLRNDRTLSAVRQTRAGCCYLTGRLLEMDGDPIAAEEEYHRTLNLAAGHPWALVRLAGIAADRGQLSTAQRLLEQSEVSEEHPLRRMVDALLQLQPQDAETRGRNEPCWCGSGRKFKVCHGRPGSAVGPVDTEALASLALTWAALEDPYTLPSLLRRVKRGVDEAALLVLQEVVPDILLIEGGALDDYLRTRGPLLPAEAALLAQQWLLRPRSAFEVEQVRAGEGLTVRDLLTGDRVEVADRTASQSLQVGELLLARIASRGSDDGIHAPIRIPHQHRESLLDLLASEPTELQLIDWLTQLWSPPTLVTPEGDLLQRVTGTFTTTSPAKLRRALDQQLEPDGEDSWDLTEPAGERTRVLATAKLQGRTLEVESTSEARYARMVQVLDGLDVPLVERDYSVEDLDLGPGTAPAPDSDAAIGADQIADNAELAEHLAVYIAEYERKWLDQQIPALGGATPRQAADDPTRRDDLIRLLESFGSDGSPLQMDGARLRAALGL